MSISKKNFGVLLIIALVLFIAVVSISFYSLSLTGALPLPFDSQFVAYCSTSSCTIG